MKIAIEDIHDEGITVDIDEPLVIEGHDHPYMVRAHLELHRIESEIVVDGSMNTEIELECSRCLKTFKRRIDDPVHMVYHPIGELGSEAHELRSDELDLGFYSGDEIDLWEVLREQIMLSLQMKPLCDAACRGICPKCGIDLNSETCSCEFKEADPRLQVLKKLLEKRKE